MKTYEFWVFTHKMDFDEHGLVGGLNFSFEKELEEEELKDYLHGFSDGIRHEIENAFIIVFDDMGRLIISNENL